MQHNAKTDIGNKLIGENISWALCTWANLKFSPMAIMFSVSARDVSAHNVLSYDEQNTVWAKVEVWPKLWINPYWPLFSFFGSNKPTYDDVIFFIREKYGCVLNYAYIVWVIRNGPGEGEEGRRLLSRMWQSSTRGMYGHPLLLQL